MRVSTDPARDSSVPRTPRRRIYLGLVSSLRSGRSTGLLESHENRALESSELSRDRPKPGSVSSLSRTRGPRTPSTYHQIMVHLPPRRQCRDFHFLLSSFNYGAVRVPDIWTNGEFKTHSSTVSRSFPEHSRYRTLARTPVFYHTLKNQREIALPSCCALHSTTHRASKRRK